MAPLLIVINSLHPYVQLLKPVLLAALWTSVSRSEVMLIPISRTDMALKLCHQYHCQFDTRM